MTELYNSFKENDIVRIKETGQTGYVSSFGLVMGKLWYQVREYPNKRHQTGEKPEIVQYCKEDEMVLVERRRTDRNRPNLN